MRQELTSACINRHLLRQQDRRPVVEGVDHVFAEALHVAALHAHCVREVALEVARVHLDLFDGAAVAQTEDGPLLAGHAQHAALIGCRRGHRAMSER